MRILAPIDSITQVKLYSFLGINEIYCGYIPFDWFDKYNKKMESMSKGNLQLSLNRREIGLANITKEEEIKELIQLAHKSNVEVYITINAPYYAENNYPFIIEYAKMVENYGADGVIISDLGLIKELRKTSSMKIVLSTCNQVMSIESVKLIRDLGVNRIVFPRHISLKEIDKITNTVLDMEYECFVLEGRCIYDDGNCNILHSCGSFCTENWITEYTNPELNTINEKLFRCVKENELDYKRYSVPYINTDKIPGGWRNGGCGLCAVPFIIKNTNITSLKVAGRGIAESQKLKNITYLKKVIKMTEEGESISKIHNYSRYDIQPWHEMCEEGYRCYFPEARKLKD